MSLKRKIISILIVIALVLSSIPLTLVSGGNTATAASADSTLVLHRPTAGIYVNDVTRVAYAVNSLKPPSGNNSVIVKATKSGVPYISSSYANIAYVGETPYSTQISFTPGVTLDAEPTISCSNTTVTYLTSTPAYSNGTYTWTVSGGTAEPGTALIFTVSYTYSETNAITGKTYTNTYETQCVSYVEAIASPAGIYTVKRTYENYVVGSDTKNRSYVATMILGENTYGSVYNGGSGDGTVDFTNNSAFTSNVSAWTSDFGNMKNFSGSSASRDYNVAYGADSNRPLSTTYIDKSVTSTLSSLNLRIHTVLPTIASSSNERVTVAYDNVYAVPGIVQTFSSDSDSEAPSNDTAVVSELGMTRPTGSIQQTTSSLSSTLQSYFEGVGPCRDIGTKEYTVTIKYNTPGGWSAVYVGQSFSFRFVTYDKGSLRTLTEEVYSSDPTSMTTSLADGEYKGYNPQSWYYSSGWEDFRTAYLNAKTILAKPDTSQTDIDNAYNSLVTAYNNLEMRRADYSLADAYYKQAVAKNKDNYTLASWAKLQNLIDNYVANYSALYQPAVDKSAVDIKAAIDALEYATADYSDFIANLNTVNKMLNEAPTIYGKPASEVYDGWSTIESVLKNSGCVYNELEGYTLGTYLDVTEQSTVDGYTLLLRNAIDNLKLNSANYTEANKAESAYKVLKLSYIVDDIAQNLTESYDALVALHGLDLSRQSDVDAAVATLKYWLDNVEYKPADITEAINIIAEANSIDRSQYSDLTAVDNAVAALEAKLDLDIRYQSEIDRGVTAVRSAINKLIANRADYTDVDAAITEADEVADNILTTYASTYGFTADTFYSNWSDVTDAINNVVRDLDNTKQAQVDGYAAAIRKALNDLVENKADYSAVNAAQQEASDIISTGSGLYTSESLSRVTNAYISVVTNLDISKQAQVDGYAQAITEAIEQLEYLPANYSEVEAKIAEANEKLADNDEYSSAHPGYSLYTGSSVSALNLAIAGVDTSLDIRYQSTVDGYVTAINDAILALEYSGADYTQVELAKANIPEDTSLYTTLSVATLNSVLKKIDTTLTADQQSKVDGYVTSINNAINGLKYKNADYSKVKTAKAKVPSDSSLYTEESWQHLQDKLNDVVEGLDIRYQAQVDTYAEAIETAINVLQYKPADYTDVNTALTEIPSDLSIYTDASVESLNEAVNSIDKYLDIRYQSTVDGYADDIRTKIGALKIKDADYSAVVNAISEANTKIAEGIYTDDSVANLNKAISDVVYNLDITKQEQVDGYATAINDAISKLEVKFVPADYTRVDAEISKIPSDLSVYTDETVNALNEAVNSVDRTLGSDQQATVDGYADAIRAAVSNLKYKSADYTAVETARGKVPTDSTIYTTESWQNLQEKLNAVVEGLNIRYQTQVDGYASDIEQAIEALELLPANYDEVTAAKGEIPTDLTLYTDETVAQLNAVLNSIQYDLDITQQATVDTYPPLIREAISKLIYKSADYSAVETAKGKVPTDSTIYTTESWQNLQEKLNAVVEGLDIRYQTQVDGYASDIEQAIEALELLPANYDEVTAAKGEIPTDLTLYTDETVAQLNAVLNSIQYDLDITQQATVDTYPPLIREAISKLSYKSADYSAVETAKGKVPTDSTVYTTESWQNLQEKLSAVVEGLDIRYQTQVDGYASDIEQAIGALEYLPADYTAVEEAIAAANAEIAKGWYTDESVANLNEKINAVVTGYTKNRQGEVDTFAENIVKATNDLVKKLANYTELQKILDLLDNSDSEIYNNTYKNFNEVMALITAYRENTVQNNMDLTADKQAQVDEMTATLQGYIDSLELVEATEVFTVKEGSTTVIKDGYIYGLKTAMTKAAFQSNYITYENVTLQYSGNSGRYLGTGTTVKVISDLTGEEIATYTIVIYGDVNGDGQINIADSDAVASSIQKLNTLSPAAKKAAKLVSRSGLALADYNALVNVIQKKATINQVTGKLS